MKSLVWARGKVTKDYTDTAFLMGSSFGPVAPFSVFDNWIHEPSYLTGMVAGSMTKSNVIGMVGGYAIPEVNRLICLYGFTRDLTLT